MANSPQYYRSRFGDTSLTKVFVGGLAWETPTEQLQRYFEQFGEILEAVIITDKNTGRSKGYGFVTFRDPESARRAVLDPNPLIDGRRANCNIAALGRPRPSPPRGRAQVTGSVYQGPPPQAAGPPYARMPAQMPPPPQVFYPSPYGYMSYTPEYGYQPGMYNPQMASAYYQQMMYGATSAASNMGHQPYNYPQMNYMVPSPRPTSFHASMMPSQRQPYGHNPTMGMPHMDIDASSFFPLSSTSPHRMHLQIPTHIRQSLATPDSQASQPSSTNGGNNEGSDV